MDRVFSFLLWPKRGARGPWKQGRKKQGSITCCTDRANEANKMFIIWLCWLFRFCKGDRELEVRTATYGPATDQSQHAKSVSHIINACTCAYYFIEPFCIVRLFRPFAFTLNNSYLLEIKKKNYVQFHNIGQLKCVTKSTKCLKIMCIILSLKS